MEKFVSVVERKRKLFIALIMIFNILAFFGLLKLRLNPDFKVFMERDSKYVSTLNDIEKYFSSSDQMSVIIEMKTDPLTINGLRKIKDIQKKLENIDGVASVISPVPDKIPFGLTQIDTTQIDEKTAKVAIDFIKKMNMDNIIKKNGKFYVQFYIMPDKRGTVKRISKLLNNIPHYFGGTTYLEEKISNYLLWIVLTLPPIAVITIFLVFKWRLGSMWATFLSIVPAGIGALWTLGFLGWLKGEVSILTVLVPIFTIVMGSADGLHFVSHFMDERKTKNNRDALVEALRSTGVALILTTITTVAGFLSLTLINSDAIAEMGLYGSVGIALAGIATWLVLPPILINTTKISDDKNKESKISTFFVHLMGKKAVLISLLLVLLFLPGIFFINSDFYMTDIYKKYTDVRKNINTVQEIFGTATPIFIFFKSKVDPVTPIFANQVLKLENELLKLPEIKKVISFYDVMSRVNEKIFNKKGYPSNLGQVLLLMKLMPDTYKNFLNRKEKAGRLIVFPTKISRNSLNKIESKISEPFKLTGAPLIMKEMNEKIVPQQVKSLMFAVGMVFLIVLLRVKDLKKAFISIIPISLTLITLFGFMGYTGIKLSIITATMGSIVIGVGIDYAIHFIENYEYNKNKGLSIKKAIEISFMHTSKPILANALGLSIGFTVMILSPFIIHTYLVEIIWVSMLSSSFMSLTLLPTLLRYVDRKKEAKVSK
ncbi:RND family transporter [Thermosipho ferrireducens]|uniref:RND family transporter n=1 Tax=Thermosipho ferrireducens TaxID=2571116 RepID=A0ABX7S6D6_9BACT|nr:efflux RND transporter permease subunit [Thermosipho ferrireducens]QTA38143.1 RND family transporter [Thermosipho ferrireducens]